jgi:tetratricopeptide (TPR) repeat protein
LLKPVLTSFLLLQAAFRPAPPARLAEALAAGDAHFERRAEGARGGTAQPFHAEGAIVEYRRALALDPDSYDARLRLLRAYFFRGGFCGPMDPAQKKQLFDEAKRVAEETVKRLDADLKRVKGKLDTGVARSIAPAAEAYVWAAVSWGQWAIFHKLNAAWTGAPARIRDLAEAVIAIDPEAAQGAGYLVLGRLHADAPHIPLVTGWVSREKGLTNLRLGLEVAPENAALSYFLGDALLRLDPSKAAEAKALLERTAAAVPRAEYQVEDLHYAEMARARLASLPGGFTPGGPPPGSAP